MSTPVNEYVGMSSSPLQRTKLHHRYEPAEIVHLGLLIFAVDHSRQIEQLSALHTQRHVHAHYCYTVSNVLKRNSLHSASHFYSYVQCSC